MTRPAEQRHDHSFPGVYSGVFGGPVSAGVTVEQDGGDLRVATEVQNLVEGHDWPTGVDFRNAFLVVEVSLAGQPLAQLDGDQVPGWASDDVDGRQEGDYGGLAGRGYAKALEGRINDLGDPVSPVSFIDADTLLAKTKIPAGQVGPAVFTFELSADASPGDIVDVRTRVIYRRLWRAIAVTKEWPDVVQGEPFERTVADVQSTHVLAGVDADLVFENGFEASL